MPVVLMKPTPSTLPRRFTVQITRGKSIILQNMYYYTSEYEKDDNEEYRI
jgi:hypothetical protein